MQKFIRVLVRADAVADITFFVNSLKGIGHVGNLYI